MKNVLVVGAGFAGSVCARELAEAGFHVIVIDRRAHVGGNCFDERDQHGYVVHRYGPHFFHTNADRVFSWLSRFTRWHRYEHRVLAEVDGRLLPFPINRTTINRLYGLDLDEAGVAAYLDRVRECRDPLLTSEDVVLNSVGRDLCEKFFRGYTKKQWGLDLSELSAGVAARIPVRINDDDRYFTDKYQGLPAEGYTRLFERILDHGGIELHLGLDSANTDIPADHTVYTGPIDTYFSSCFGRLPYRSLLFEHEHLASVDLLQPVCTVNYPNEKPYTRVTEFKHATGQQGPGTSIVREYPSAEGEPYYPIPTAKNSELHARYRLLADNEPTVTFVGRLAEYRYYNMDQAIAASLKASERIVSLLGR
jgi:UDP-galactopyranose mutase